MAFWKKIFKSKYTGAEIDAAVAKAGTVPAVTEADAGKALVVDEEGKIAPQGSFVIDVTGTITESGFSATTMVTPAQVTAAVLASKSINIHVTFQGIEFSLINVGVIFKDNLYSPAILILSLNLITSDLYGILRFEYYSESPDNPFIIDIDTFSANV